MALQPRHQLAAVDEELDLALAVDRREAQRQRRVRHVAAPDVEQPGQRIGLRQHRRRGARGGHRGTDRLPLVGGIAAGEVLLLRADRRQGRRGLRLPDGVERIVGTGDRRGADRRQGGLEPGHPVDGVQPGIEAQPIAAGKLGSQPFLRRLLDQVADLEGGAVDLRRRLQGIAAIDEKCRPLGQHHGDAGRPGEAGQPGQPLGPRRHVFALVLVGPRHDEAAEIAPGKLLPQCSKAAGELTLGRRSGGVARPAVRRSPQLAQGQKLSPQLVARAVRDEVDPGRRVGAFRRRVDPRQQGGNPCNVIGRSGVPQQSFEAGITLVLACAAGLVHATPPLAEPPEREACNGRHRRPRPDRVMQKYGSMCQESCLWCNAAMQQIPSAAAPFRPISASNPW